MSTHRRQRRGRKALGDYSEESYEPSFYPSGGEPEVTTAPEKLGVETYDDYLGKTCLLQTPAGRDLGRHEENTGRYRICLSKTQYRRLFGRSKPVFLGKGAAAVAYAKGENRVVKITRDPDDIAALVEAKGLPHVVKTYKIYELENAGVNLQARMKPAPLRLWAVIAERLEPVSPDTADLVNNIPTYELQDHYETIRNAHGASRYTIGTDLRARLTDNACAGHRGSTIARCTRFMSQYLDTFEALGRRGIAFLDTHDGNFAETKTGKWKIIDLGISDTRRPPPELPVLTGVFSGARGTPHYRLRMPRFTKLK